MTKPNITKSITKNELNNAYNHIETSDAPIFAGATKSKTQLLITLDKEFQILSNQSKQLCPSYTGLSRRTSGPKQFRGVYTRTNLSLKGIKARSPAEFIQNWRKENPKL